jgi:hypothetical protein
MGEEEDREAKASIPQNSKNGQKMIYSFELDWIPQNYKFI